MGLFGPDHRPEVYLMRLQQDFAFLGLFDLVVSTHTLQYIPDRKDIVARLSERVAQGGSLIIEDEAIYLDLYLQMLEPEYEEIELMYTRFEDCSRMDKMPPEEHAALALKEMTAPNRPEGHTSIYVCARRKRASSTRTVDVPELVPDDGLRIVKSEIPYLLS